jgi:hypothetical protein
MCGDPRFLPRTTTEQNGNRLKTTNKLLLFALAAEETLFLRYMICFHPDKAASKKQPRPYLFADLSVTYSLWQ